MAPNVYGSSTIGVKKETVCTRARLSVSLYTPASSLVSKPTNTFSFGTRGKLASTWSKIFGLSLDAQPAAFTWAVNLALNLSPSHLIIGEVGGHVRSTAALTLVLLFGAAVALVSREPQADPRLKNAFRRPSENGWTYVHLEGAPSDIGYQ